MANALRILIVTQYFWPESFRINDLALGLKERGHEVTVLTGMPNYPGGRLFPGYGAIDARIGSTTTASRSSASRSFRGSPAGGGSSRSTTSPSRCRASVLGPLRCRGRFDVIFVYEPSPVTVGLPAIVLKTAQARADPVLGAGSLAREPGRDRGGEVAHRAAVGEAARALHLPALRPRAGAVGRIHRRGRSAWMPSRRGSSTFRTGRRRSTAPRAWPRTRRSAPRCPRDSASCSRATSARRSRSRRSWRRRSVCGHTTRSSGSILGDGQQRPWVEQEVEKRGLRERVHLLGQHPIQTMPTWFALADALLVTLARRPDLRANHPEQDPVLPGVRPADRRRPRRGRGADHSRVRRRPHLLRRRREGLAECGHDASIECLARSAERMGARGRSYFAANFERERLLDKLETWMRPTRGGRRAHPDPRRRRHAGPPAARASGAAA